VRGYDPRLILRAVALRALGQHLLQRRLCPHRKVTACAALLLAEMPHQRRRALRVTREEEAAELIVGEGSEERSERHGYSVVQLARREYRGLRRSG
jgi:hypothetical protein